MSVAERLASRSPHIPEKFVDTDDGELVVDRDLARSLVMAARKSDGDVPNYSGIGSALAGGEGTVSESYIREVLSSVPEWAGVPVRVRDSAVPFDPSTLDFAGGNAFERDEIEAYFKGDASAFTEADAEAFTGDRLFISSTPSNGTSVSLYETEDREDRIVTASLRDERDLSQFVNRLRTTSVDSLGALGIKTVGPSEDRVGQRQRRETREAARDAARDAGIDLDEYDVGAAYGADAEPGTVVIQNKETNETRRIDPSENLADAIDQQTDGGSFEPTSSSSSTDRTSNVPSVDDLGGGRLAAAVAIGAAVLYGVTQS